MCTLVLIGRSTRFSVIVLFCFVSSADQSVKRNWNNVCALNKLWKWCDKVANCLGYGM